MLTWTGIVARQDIVTLDPAIPSMSDTAGNVVTYDSKKVHKAATAEGI